jgi:hypothetical protein
VTVSVHSLAPWLLPKHSDTAKYSAVLRHVRHAESALLLVPRFDPGGMYHSTYLLLTAYNPASSTGQARGVVCLHMYEPHVPTRLNALTKALSVYEYIFCAHGTASVAFCNEAMLLLP